MFDRHQRRGLRKLAKLVFGPETEMKKLRHLEWSCQIARVLCFHDLYQVATTPVCEMTGLEVHREQNPQMAVMFEWHKGGQVAFVSTAHTIEQIKNEENDVKKVLYCQQLMLCASESEKQEWKPWIEKILEPLKG